MPRVLGRLGSAPTPAVMEAVFTRWDELVGTELGGHLRPLRVDGRVLVVAVEHPAWATRARMESGQILARLQGAGGDLHRALGGRRRARADRHIAWRCRRPFRSAELEPLSGRMVRSHRKAGDHRFGDSIRTAKTYVLKGRACGSKGG